jgi:drug/metabolite transporter (DMT)-like permease
MQASTKGWINGLLGVLIFSGSLPATRLAVEGFSPIFLTSARAAIAALLGIFLLYVLRQQRPDKEDLFSLCLISIGVVIGFPLLTALALQTITAAHSIVFIGLLPFATAVFAVLRGGERPGKLFWLFSCLGSLSVALFALSSSDGGTLIGDLLMLGAIIICGLGYAEGAALSRRLGGWQVISWALLLSLPIMALVAMITLPDFSNAIAPSAWLGLGYVSVFSMLIGFVFWYRGLAMGGIAAVGQLQLLQPFFGLLLAFLLLGEHIGWPMIAVTLFVIGCVAGAKKYA